MPCPSSKKYTGELYSIENKKIIFVGLFHDLFALPMIAFIPLMKWQVFVNSEPNLTEMMAVNGDQQIFKTIFYPISHWLKCWSSF